MQATQLKLLLDKHAAVLRTSGAELMSDTVGRLAGAVGHGGTQTVAKLAAAIEKAAPTASGGARPLLGEAVATIEALIDLLNEGGAKKAVVADLEVLLDLLRRYSEVSVSEFESVVDRTVASASRGKGKPGAPAVDTKDLIESYIAKLEAALGNDALFRAAHRELGADKRIGREAAVEIASRFFERMPASATRPKALQNIFNRHERLLDSRAASSTIGGKAA